MRTAAILSIVVTVGGHLVGCRGAQTPDGGASERPGTKTQSARPPAAPRPTPAPLPSGAREAPAPSVDSGPPLPKNPPPLPPGVSPGEPVVLKVPKDRPIHVIHADPGVRHAIVYLHGVCGDIYAIRPWGDVVVKHGTMVALLGDGSCGKTSGRYRWGSDTRALDARIDRALGVVKEARGGALDTDEVTVFGYSQGAGRAEALAKRYGDRYTRLVLAGLPAAPSAASFTRARSIAVVTGEREPTTIVDAGLEILRGASKRAELFVLPEAGHGQYGPDARRVLSEMFSWLYQQPTHPPPP